MNQYIWRSPKCADAGAHLESVLIGVSMVCGIIGEIFETFQVEAWREVVHCLCVQWPFQGRLFHRGFFFPSKKMKLFFKNYYLYQTVQFSQKDYSTLSILKTFLQSYLTIFHKYIVKNVIFKCCGMLPQNWCIRKYRAILQQFLMSYPAFREGLL